MDDSLRPRETSRIRDPARGERPQDITYKQGTYQGKPDSRPWDNEPFKGDQKAWELALKDRAQSQNEYKRTN